VETRSSHFIVGIFVLVLVGGLVAFTVWSVKSDVDATSTKTYQIYFRGSVSGLSGASEVRYRGIPIGQVTDIQIDPDDVERVRVMIEVRANTPIKEDSIAQVELQGITGGSFVQISGGSNASPTLEAEEDEEHPIIQSRRGQLEELFAGTPELINRVTELVGTVANIFSEENQDAISATLANVQILSDTLAANSGNVDTLISDVSLTAQDLRQAAVEIRGLAGELRGNLDELATTANTTVASAGENIDILGRGMQALMGDLRETSQSLTRTSNEIGSLLAESREPIRDFTSEGLYDLSRLVSEMRDLVASLTRVGEQLESDAPGFLFGTPEEGFRAQ
jgi:phospholipid/cholesterol/gamma-HCH transport system substrate-binding protein